MCNLKTCCCCFSLRAGALNAAIFTIVLGVLGFIPWVNTAIDENKARNNKWNDEDLSTTEITAYVQVALYGLWIVTAVILLLAICTRTRGCLIPWCVVTLIMVVIAIWGIVITIMQIVDEDGEVHWKAWFSLIISIVVVVFNFYSVLVVCSYHKQNMNEYVV